MRLAVSFTNLGPYHFARLRALAKRAASEATSVTVIETASRERKYPWQVADSLEGFDRTTLFPGRDLESIPAAECSRSMRAALDRSRPEVVAIAGYVRPECLEALRWGRERERPVVLMSESQEIDRPRVWWKERVKRHRVTRCSAALVGGPRHREYLAKLGLDESRVVLGYNAVDNLRFARGVEAARLAGSANASGRRYFLAVNRFAPEKNLERLILAYGRYRRICGDKNSWDLVLLGDGELRGELERLVAREGLSEHVRLPGFLDEAGVIESLAFASAFVHPSISEPWGLVVNEAAAAGLPLAVSDRAGCVETLVPDPPGATGWRFDPFSIEDITTCLIRFADLSDEQLRAVGDRAARIASEWGPDRFATGLLRAVEIAADHHRARSRTRRSPGRYSSGGVT